MDNFYSLYDTKADSYTPPFLAKNDELAKRMIEQTFTNLEGQKCALTDYPADFVLFRVGVWNDVEGTLSPLEFTINCGNVLQIVNVLRQAPKVEAVTEEVE